MTTVFTDNDGCGCTSGHNREQLCGMCTHKLHEFHDANNGTGRTGIQIVGVLSCSFLLCVGVATLMRRQLCAVFVLLCAASAQLPRPENLVVRVQSSPLNATTGTNWQKTWQDSSVRPHHIVSPLLAIFTWNSPGLAVSHTPIANTMYVCV